MHQRGLSPLTLQTRKHWWGFFPTAKYYIKYRVLCQNDFISEVNGSFSNPNVAAMCWFFFQLVITYQCKIIQQRKNLKKLLTLGQNFYWCTTKIKNKDGGRPPCLHLETISFSQPLTFTQDWGPNMCVGCAIHKLWLKEAARFLSF